MNMDVNVQSAQASQAIIRESAPAVQNPRPAVQTPQPQIETQPPQTRSSQSVRATLRDEDVSDNMLEQAFVDVNRVLAGSEFRLSYGIHEPTNRVTVAVYDNEGELIREIPSEERLDLYAKITEFTGLLFDERT